jgi:hypothetical protein
MFQLKVNSEETVASIFTILPSALSVSRRFGMCKSCFPGGAYVDMFNVIYSEVS